MSVDDLVQEYDRKSKDVDLTVELCRQEIARRELEEHSQRMLTMTATVTRLTWVITALTAINMVLVSLQIWGCFRS
jgi:hypothetical protein